MRICIFIFLLASCSNLSEKKVLVDELVFQNGRVGNRTWSDDLIFKRASLYSRSYMELDVYIAVLSKESGFANWLSLDEKKFLNQCTTLLVSVSTANSSKVINDAMYRTQMKKNNFEEVIAPDFMEHLRLHPDYVGWNLNPYKTRLFCSKLQKNQVSLIFPSFQEVVIKL